jgi:hypothetical protein
MNTFRQIPGLLPFAHYIILPSFLLKWDLEVNMVDFIINMLDFEAFNEVYLFISVMSNM